MADVIQLLPDHVANQIAAGEVIQRPASVVKELVENAVDAGSTSIKIILKDAGKTLIQIIDNGCGMTETDARLAFERHATSKIHDVNDLFSIRTKGFRGEALASIAAIAHVCLKSKTHELELGTELQIAGSKVESQEPAQCPTGSNFAIKNIFYNVPARRKFLKTDSTELKHVINEFHRISLAHPEIEFIMYHNNNELFNLPESNIKQRIISSFGKQMNQQLVRLENETTIVKIHGYLGKPEHAKKTSGEQFFFVNNRYMRSPYLHKAVTQAYEDLIASDQIPSYFIYFDIDPEAIDINIHPTKTEIKFEDERAIWQILRSSVKEILGKSNFMPAIDFDTSGKIDIPVSKTQAPKKEPSIDINPAYNPFKEQTPTERKNQKDLNNWEELYRDFDDAKNAITKTASFDETPEADQQNLKHDVNQNRFFQFKNKYIITSVKSGLMIIDQQRAHQRILFERFVQSLAMNKGIAQQSLFPQTIEMNAADFAIIHEIIDDLSALGFDIRDFGNNSVVIHGLPADTEQTNTEELIHQLLEDYKNSKNDIQANQKQKIAKALARASAIRQQPLKQEEMQELFHQLFACEAPSYAPNGKQIVNILSVEEIDKRF